MSTDTRTVLFVTGNRAEYDILYPVIRAADATGSLKSEIIVTGAHLVSRFGLTVREIEADGVPIVARIDNLLASDSDTGRIKSAAIQLASLVDVISVRRPDFLVVVGDREEALTVSAAGVYLNVPVVHIGGGDTADDANVDNLVRHATTKLAHLHMAASEESAKRILRLGEEPWRVHVVGAPGLDRFVNETHLAPDALWGRLGIEPIDEPFALVIQHPLQPEMDDAFAQMDATLTALEWVGIPTFVLSPNSDPGNSGTVRAIELHAARNPKLHIYKNLPRNLFVNLMRQASVMVGNSSSGIIEAPLLGLPVVNVGTRQRGREHAGNVTFVSYCVDEIAAAILRAVTDADYRKRVKTCTTPYGDGSAGQKIAKILAQETDRVRLLAKRNTF